jgi:hypothetical protein
VGGYKILYKTWYWPVFVLRLVYAWFMFRFRLVSLITKSVTKVTKAIFVIKIDLYYGGEHEKMSLGGDKKFGE